MKFIKMHGLGNDFVILDGRAQPVSLNELAVRAIANRKTGVGCDQLIVIEPGARVPFMRIYNADGSEVDACGNATRCVGWLLMEEGGCDAVSIQTGAGQLKAMRAGDWSVTVNMGEPRLQAKAIPLADSVDTLFVPVDHAELPEPVAVNMGNPHWVFFVSDLEAVPASEWGATLEHHLLLPERGNISFVKAEGENRFRAIVWERGAGLTEACGTAACAIQVAARRRGMSDAEAVVQLPGGDLTIRWDGNESDPKHPVWMTGAVAESFSGVLGPDLVKALSL